MVNHQYSIRQVQDFNLNTFKNTENSIPVPSLKELATFYYANKKNVYVYEVICNNEVIAILPFVFMIARINGVNFKQFRPIGWNMYDYLSIHTLNSSSLLKILYAFKEATNKLPIDVIYFPQILIGNNEEADLKAYLKTSQTKCFDASLSDKGWDLLLQKKSLRRHVNRLKNKGDYQIIIKHGQEISREDIQFISQTHQERWQFSSSSSPFTEPMRQNEYAAFLENKTLLMVQLDKHWIAYHFGILFNNTLLWHSPVINIKYLDYSPLEVLLSETIAYCKTNNIKTLDLGIGDEFYKTRFFNTTRSVHELFFPISLKGKAFNLLRNIINLTLVKDKATSFIKQLKNSYHKISKIRNTIIIYSFATAQNNITDDNFTIINNYEDFVDFCRNNSFSILNWHYDRFKYENASFCCLSENKKIISWGWISHKDTFFIEEINRELSFDKQTILFDFVTSLEFRNRGYYKKLLNAIINYFPSEKLLIYANSNNFPSLRAIEKVGFKPMMKVNAFYTKILHHE